jgi:hypothetical protein
MAFVKLQRDSFENTSVTLRPKIHFVSSSLGVTGSEFVSPVRSKCIKKTKAPKPPDISGFASLFFEILQPENVITAIANKVKGSSSISPETNVNSELDTYLNLVVPKAALDERYSKTIDIHRVDPSFKFEPPGGLNLTIKNNVRNILMPHYKHKYADTGFFYRNFNTVNFFTASNLPENSVLLYPDNSDHYVPNRSFATSFWINPRYKSESSQDFKAGTLLHISSSLCISLISGSNKDVNEKVDTFKILVQLSQSADTPPSQIDFSNLSYPNDLVFTSSNELKWNNWHSVVFNWGASLYNDFTSSLYIDDQKTDFVIPSSSIGTPTKNVDGNSAIFVGNYYEGNANNISKFFNTTTAVNEGVIALDSGTADPATSEYNFRHMLNAEFHELKVFNTHLSGSEVKTRHYKSEKSKTNLSFYLPPYYVPSSSQRDIIQTPFQKTRSASNDPFNVAFSFGVGGKEINAENFVKDFKTERQPRLFHMTSSVINKTIQNITADDYVYASGSILRRNFLLLPNDNGQFFPSFDLLEQEVITKELDSFYITEGEGVDYSKIKLENLIPESSLFPGLISENGPLANIIGASPENPGVIPGTVLTIAQRTRDTSSNEIVIFNISNIFYGDRIVPGSLELIDNGLTGSNDKIQINVKDNKKGSLYRADCLTPQALWNSIGNVFYDEGVAILKTPHLPYFQKDRTEVKLQGDHKIHAFTINVPVEKSLLNKSQNEAFKALPPSLNENDKDLETIMISSVNIHDENFNIIMRANFAQPITKTQKDEFIIRLKEDF